MGTGQVDDLGDLPSTDDVGGTEIGAVIGWYARFSGVATRVALDNAENREAFNIGIESVARNHILEGLAARGCAKVESESDHFC